MHGKRGVVIVSCLCFVKEKVTWLMLDVLPVAAVFLTSYFPTRHWSWQLWVCKGKCFFVNVIPMYSGDSCIVLYKWHHTFVWVRLYTFSVQSRNLHSMSWKQRDKLDFGSSWRWVSVVAAWCSSCFAVLWKWLIVFVGRMLGIYLNKSGCSGQEKNLHSYQR